MSTPLILVIDRAPEDAQAINTTLRNAGLSIQIEFIGSLSELDDALNSGHADLLVYGDPDPDQIALDDVVRVLQAENRFLPAICLLRDESPDNQVQAALAAGFSLFSQAGEEDQLLRTIRRELANLEARRLMNEGRRERDEINQRYQLLLDSARDPIAYIHQGLHIYANRAYMELFGFESMEDAEATSVLELVKLEKDQDLKALLRDIGKDNYPDGSLEGTVTTGDEGQSVRLNFSPSVFHGEDCTQLMVTEIAAEEDSGVMTPGLADELEKLRRQDSLTGLGNRSWFTSELENALKLEQSDTDNERGVIYLEPDGFAEIQGDLGVSQTDVVLKDIGELLDQQSEDNDVIARFTDHGFTLLIERQTRDEIVAFANGLLEAFRDKIIEADGRSMAVQASLGLTYLSEVTSDTEEVFRHARRAWREAVQAGGNQLNEYRPDFSDEDESESDDQWSERIRFALGNHQFTVLTQPISDLEADSEPMTEVYYQLDEDDGSHDYAEFAAAAERTGTAASIDRSLIPVALGALEQDADIEALVIPVSGASVQDFSFAAWLRHELESRNIVPSKVILSMPTAQLEQQIKPAQKLINELSDSGFRFAAYGMHNEPRQLKLMDHLNLQYIKVSPELIGNLVGSSRKQDAVEALADAARKHETQPFAGDVEDAASLAVLWQAGVKLVQGEFLKPKTPVGAADTQPPEAQPASSG